MKIKVKQSGERVDAFLARELNLSRSKIQKLLQTGKIKVNNQLVKNNYEIVTGDEIIVTEKQVEPEKIVPENIPLDIIYEDDYLLVVNKPKGLLVHPGAGRKNQTLVNALLYHGKSLSQVNEERPGIVHRLDADTSGLLLVAKTDEAHHKLVEDLSQRRIKRIYLALVWGVIPNQTGLIDAPIGRDKKNRQRYAVTALNSKAAYTHFRVLERFQDTTLLEITLETGRTHQIRVHMQYIGFPVVNDPVYSHITTLDASGQCLHAKTISFVHPITGKTMEFTCEPPEAFNHIIKLSTGGDNNA